MRFLALILSLACLPACSSQSGMLFGRSPERLIADGKAITEVISTQYAMQLRAGGKTEAEIQEKMAPFDHVNALLDEALAAYRDDDRFGGADLFRVASRMAYRVYVDSLDPADENYQRNVSYAQGLLLISTILFPEPAPAPAPEATP